MKYFHARIFLFLNYLCSQIRDIEIVVVRKFISEKLQLFEIFSVLRELLDSRLTDLLFKLVEPEFYLLEACVWLIESRDHREWLAHYHAAVRVLDVRNFNTVDNFILSFHSNFVSEGASSPLEAATSHFYIVIDADSGVEESGILISYFKFWVKVR